jgi:hypothetical protein
VAEVKTGKDLERSKLLSLTLEEVTVGTNLPISADFAPDEPPLSTDSR